MELTITQSGALYLASRRILKERTAFFQRARITADRQATSVRRNLNASETLAGRQCHPDNGR